MFDLQKSAKKSLIFSGSCCLEGSIQPSGQRNSLHGGVVPDGRGHRHGPGEHLLKTC